jgi:phage gp46-like protein
MPIINERDFPLLPSQKAVRRRTAKHGTNDNASPSRISRSHASLVDLPDELILEIIDYLPGIDLDHFQLPTLLSLALTSRRLYRVVIEIIYARYNSHFCEPYTFLRTMMSNLRLAEFVHNIDMTFGSRTHREGRRYRPTARDKKTIKEGLRALGTSDWKEWATRCNEDLVNDDALQNAILLHTPKITSLSILDFVTDRPRHRSWFDLITKAAAGTLSAQSHRFEHLRSIRVDARTSSLNDLAPLFRVQSLRKLQLREIYEYGMFDCITCRDPREHIEKSALKLQRLIPPACNNLEELDLERTYFSMLSLEVLLSSSRCLKSFKYDVSFDYLLHRETPDEDCRNTLSEVLGSLKVSLEALDVFCDPIVDERNRRVVHLRDGLKAFVALKQLSCPLGMIMDGCTDTFAERLPSSLLTFQTPVRRFTEDQHCLDALKDVAFCYRKHVPRLEEVRVIAPRSASWFRYDWEPLVQLFSAETSISFLVQHEDDDEDFGDWQDDSTESSRSSDEVDLYSDDD